MKKRVEHINHKLIINRIKIAMIVFVCVLLCIIQLISLIKGNNYDKYVLTQNVVVEHNGKKVFEGNIDEYHAENVKADDNYMMYMDIPKNTLKNPAIQYDNINTAVKVYVDNKKVYSIGDNTPKGGIVCHAFNKVPLCDINNKKQVVMSIKVMNGSTLTRLPRVYMMNTYDIDEEYYYSMHIYIVIGYYFAIIGIIGLAIVAFLRKRDIITLKMFILTCMCIVSSAYMISMFQVIPLFCDNYVLDAFVEYGTRVYLPFLINLYMVFEYPKGNKKISLILATISGTHATIAMVLQYFKIMYLNDTMVFFLIWYVFAGINIIGYYLKYRKDFINKKVLTGVTSAVLVLVVLYVTVHIFFSNYSDYFLVVVPIAILIVITIFFMELITEVTSNMISEAKKRALEEMAYLDALTHISNRRGFEKFISINKNYTGKYNIYSFDLNKLKVINDTYGHAMGDEYIKSFAQELKNTFAGGFCARMGGDEFVAVIDSKKGNVLDKLKQQIAQYNVNNINEIELTYSVGMVEYIPTKDKLDDVLKKADEMMYKMKEDRKK